MNHTTDKFELVFFFSSKIYLTFVWICMYLTLVNIHLFMNKQSKIVVIVRLVVNLHLSQQCLWRYIEWATPVLADQTVMLCLQPENLKTEISN